jgi:2-polyprenyl-3-methyl-5-hydroxy-6-metoxy-1,4-benzoquinol methylase
MINTNPYKLNLSSQYSTHNIIINNVGRNNFVLDVGCNNGYIGKNSDPSNKFYGIDYLDGEVIKAKESYHDAIVYNLNDLKFLPWNIKFDLIIFADVLEHVLYPDVVLNFFASNYLKDGGKVIVSLPNVANWQIRCSLLLGNFNYTDTGILDKTHLHLYTFKSAKNLIYKSNLKSINILSGASFFGPLIKIVPFLNSLLATNIIIIATKK